MAGRRTLIWALALTLPFAGCIDAIRGEDDDIGTTATGDAPLTVLLNADNVPDDVTHYVIEVAAVLVHDAGVDAPDGYYELDVDAAQATIVADGASVRVSLASGRLPAGQYDQVLIRVTNLQSHGGSGADLDALDLPINVAFTVKRDTPTSVEIVLDGAKDPASELSQLIERVVISEDGTVVATKTGVAVATEGGGPSGPVARAPPVSRMSIFGPDGALAYRASFLAPDKEFANDEGSAFPSGEDASFSGAGSEAVEVGATLSTYAWDFDDGETATGQAVAHAFEAPGVYEVKLTVTDSFGTKDSQLVRVVVEGGLWTTILASESFEEGAGDWTVDVAGDLGLSDWAVEGPGHDSEMAFHAATALPSPTEVVAPYTPIDNTTLHSPEYVIPSAWSSAGYAFFLSGSAQSLNQILGPGALQIWYTVDGTRADVFAIDGGAMDWTEFAETGGLTGAVGKTVQFHFAFTTADPASPSDVGWFVDDFAIGGVDLPVHKAALIEEIPGHGGPGHSH